MAVYEPASNLIVHSAKVDMKSRAVPDIVHLVQYDNQTPVLAMSLYYGSEPYAVPDDTVITLRVGKPDGTVVTSEALGTDTERTVVYFAVTQQMTAAAGEAMAVVELVIGDRVAASGGLALRIDRNPVPNESLKSASEINLMLMISASDIVISDTAPSKYPVLWFDTGEV